MFLHPSEVTVQKKRKIPKRMPWPSRSGPANSPVEGKVVQIYHCLQFFFLNLSQVGWLFRISEPSTVGKIFCCFSLQLLNSFPVDVCWFFLFFGEVSLYSGIFHESFMKVCHQCVIFRSVVATHIFF